MEFRHPYFFLLLIILPLVFWLFRKRQRMQLSFSNLDLLPATISLRMILYRFLPILKAIALILIIIALARPTLVSTEKEYDTQGVDIMISLDISGSMVAEDFKPHNRLHVAKEEAKKFIEGRENDRIGLVVFAKKAFTQCPLTLDYVILNQLMNEIDVGMIEDGTAIGMGIATAVNRLRNSEAKSKVIILITDGENNSGNIDPITAAELAKTFGIKVYAIAVGKGGLVNYPYQDPLFGKRYAQVEVKVDEFTLKRIADISGGRFFRARDPKTLHQIYEKINDLEKTEIKVKEYKSYDERFPLFLIPALILLGIDLLLKRTLFLKVP